MRVLTLYVLLLIAPSVLGAGLPYECGSLENAYGPFDYTNPQHVRNKLPIVDSAHFTPEVEALRGGKTASLPGPDIDYTLRAFPNHHRALYSMLQLYRFYKTSRRLPGVRYPAFCWFERAVSFAPQDGAAHLLRGLFLMEAGEPEQADQAFLTAVRLSPNSPEVHYNYGLMLAAQGRFDKAREHAHRAYELGFPLPGLRRILTEAGEWDDSESSVDNPSPR